MASGGPVQADDVLDLLAQLVDKSLLVAEPTASEARYRMLETIRDYAQERLAEIRRRVRTLGGTVTGSWLWSTRRDRASSPAAMQATGSPGSPTTTTTCARPCAGPTRTPTARARS